MSCCQQQLGFALHSALRLIKSVWFFPLCLAHFLVQKVTPQTDGSSSKVKVKVRVNIHGIFSVSSASLVEVHKSDENEEPMETDQHAKEEEVTASLLPAAQNPHKAQLAKLSALCEDLLDMPTTEI